LEQEGFSLNHRARVKSTISSFARWLVEEKGLLLRNPTRGVDLPAQQALAPRQLSEDQRYILRTLVEQEEDRRGAAIFALATKERTIASYSFRIYHSCSLFNQLVPPVFYSFLLDRNLVQIQHFSRQRWADSAVLPIILSGFTATAYSNVVCPEEGMGVGIVIAREVALTNYFSLVQKWTCPAKVKQGFLEAKTFAEQLAQEQQLLAQARYPKDYLRISSLARRSTQALHLMGPASTQLTSLRQVITQMGASHLDTTAFKQEAANDLQLFRSARQPEDFVLLIDLITAQLQAATTFSVQAIPYLGAAMLEQLRADIELTRSYGQDVSRFRQRLEADRAALARAKTMGDYLQVAAQIERDLASIQLPKTRGQATFLLKQFHQEVRRWGQAHTYHNPFNGVTYRLDYEYDQQGIGSDLDAAVSSAQALDDYQAAVELIQHAFFHLKAMEADATDKTPWNRPHASDLQLIEHYQLRTGQVLVISLLEQTARLYQDGKLVKSFQITTGQYVLPTPPGRWEVFRRESPTVFKSGEPEGSAFWYPDTHINYAMEFHEGGYFIHDSWWRADYGVGTNFPHYDSDGDQFFAGNGSHGCVNLVPADAAWLYTHTGYGLPVLIY
jgi:hypothetical protein